MKSSLILAILLLFITGINFATSAPCLSCSVLQNASAANILLLMNNANHTLEINAYYTNLSQANPKQPINDSIIIVELSNTTGLKTIYKVYTNDNGQALYDFSSFANSCVSFRVLYCPFCNDPSFDYCGFQQCLNYSSISNASSVYASVTNPLGITNISDIPDAPSPSTGPPSVQSSVKFLPDIEQISYCPPPPPLGATPALCLPLLIIFSLLSGALYMTGKNPFAGFNVGGARIGEHLKYQARGRGFSFSIMQAIQAVSSVSSAAKTMAKGEDKTDSKGEVQKDKNGKTIHLTGFAALAQSESRSAGHRGPLETFRSISTAGGLSARAERAKTGVGGAGARTSGGGIQNVGGGQLGFGGGGGRLSSPGDLVQTGKGVAGNIFGTIARILLFTATQTTLGKALSPFYQLVTGRDLLDSALGNHGRAAVQAAVSAMGTARNADGTWNVQGGDGRPVRVISGPGVNIDPETTLPTGIVRGPNGNATFVLAAPTGTEQGQTANGQMTVTVNAKNQVVSISYVVNGLAPVSQPTTSNPNAPSNPTGAAIVTININPDTHQQSPPQVVAAVVTASLGPDGHPVQNFTTAPNAQPIPLPNQVAIDKATSPMIMGMPSTMLGGVAAPFVESYANARADYQSFSQTAVSEYRQVQSEKSDHINSAAQSEPGSRDAIAQAQDTESRRAWGTVLPQTAVLTGSSEVFGSSTPGQPSALQRDAIGTSEAWNSSQMAQVQPQVTASLIAQNSGLSGQNQVQLEAALTQVLSTLPLSQRQNMNVADLQQQLTSAGYANAAQLVSQSGPAIVQSIQGSVAGYPESLRSQGVPEPVVSALMNSTYAANSQVANSGSLLRPENVASLLGSNPQYLNDYRLSEGIRQDAREAANISGALTALNNDNVHAIQQTTAQYVQTSMINTSQRDGIFDNKHLGEGTYIQASQAIDQSIEATRLSSLTPVDPARIASLASDGNLASARYFAAQGYDQMNTAYEATRTRYDALPDGQERETLAQQRLAIDAARTGYSHAMDFIDQHGGGGNRQCVEMPSQSLPNPDALGSARTGIGNTQAWMSHQSDTGLTAVTTAIESGRPPPITPPPRARPRLGDYESPPNTGDANA